MTDRSTEQRTESDKQGEPEFKPYHHPAAGWGAAISVTKFLAREREPIS